VTELVRAALIALSLLLLASFKFPQLRRVKGSYSERVKERVDRFLKKVYPLIGAVGLSLSLVDPLLGLMVVLASLVAVSAYASRIALREVELESLYEGAEGRPLEVWKGARRFLAISVAMYVVFVLALLISYTSLPPRLVVHLGPSGPNGWGSKATFAALYIFANTVAFAVTALLSWLSLNNPAALPRPYPRSAKALVRLLLLVQLIVGLSSLYLILWNLNSPSSLKG